MAKNFLEQITIKAVAEGFDKINQQVEAVAKKADALGKKFESVGKTLSISVTAPIIAFAGIAIKEFAQAEKAIAKVNSALQVTGNRIGITFDELQKASQNLQKNSIFGDDEILDKVSSQLLRVGTLTKENFFKAQQAVIDLSAALDGDLQGATLQVAKALENPVEAINSLSRIGVRFSKDQQAVIKSLVDTGREADAQAIIIDRLNAKFEGTAKTIAGTFGGQLIQLKNIFGDLAEVIGGRLAVILEPFVQTLKNVLTNLQSLSPQVLDLAIKFGIVAAAIGPASIALGLFLSNITLIINPITIGIAALVGITSALDALASKFTFVSRIFSALNVITFSLINVFLRLNQGLNLFLASVVNIGVALREITGVGPDLTKLQNQLLEFSTKFAEKAKITGDIVVEELANIFKGQERNIISVNDLFPKLDEIKNGLLKKGEDLGKSLGDGVGAGFRKSNPFAVSAQLAGDKLEQELIRIREQYNKLTETGEIFVNSFTTAFSNIASGAESLGQSFKNLGRSIINSIAGAAIRNAFTSLFQNLGGVFTFGGVSAGAPNITGAAEGGPIRGPGGPKTDSIPAWLSNGEYVINAKSAGMLGLSLLNKLNSLGKGFNPKSRLGLPAFADGGAVSGGGGVSVNVINNSSQPVNARASTRFDGRQLIIDTFLEDARNNGPMSQNIQNLYGVRR